MKVARLFAVVALIFTGTQVPLHPGAAVLARPLASYRSPMLSPIVVTFVRPISTYTEDASIAPGDKVTYTWSKDNERDCGQFGPMATAPNIATWWHPDASGGGNCPDESIHPGLITLTVSDGTWECTAVYPDGSGPGTGPAPQPCTEVATDTPTATPSDTATAMATVTLTTTATGTATTSATATETATETETPTMSETPSLTPSATETPIPACHPTLTVDYLTLELPSTQSGKPVAPSWSLLATGSGWNAGGTVEVLVDGKSRGTIAVDADGSWHFGDTLDITIVPPGTHTLKGVEGSPGSNDYCFRNTTFSTDTPEATKALADYKQAKNDYYTPYSRWIGRAGTGVQAIGVGLAVAGTASDATIIGIPPGIGMQITGALVGLVGTGINQVGTEVGYWANDPPDPAFRQLARMQPVGYEALTSVALTGMPPRIKAALNALTTNLNQQAAVMEAADTSINRAGSAKRANVKACVVFQYQAAVRYARRADALASARPALIRNLIAALNAAGIHSLVVPAGLIRRGMLALQAHRDQSRASAYFRAVYGQARAGAAEKALLAAYRAGSVPTSPVDVLALLRDSRLGAARSLTAFALLSTGLNVQANPNDCTGGR